MEDQGFDRVRASHHLMLPRGEFAVKGAFFARCCLYLQSPGLRKATRIPGKGDDAAYEGAAIFRSMWWWGPPTVTLMIIFVSLFLISVALDELANP